MTQSLAPAVPPMSRQHFLDLLPERMSAANSQLESAFLADRWRPRLRDLNGEMRDLARTCRDHRLIATEEAAVGLADLLQGVIESDVPMTPELQQKIRSYFETLRLAAEHAERYAGDTEQSLRMALAEASAPQTGHPIYCLSLDRVLAEHLAHQLTAFGYTLRVFHDPEEMNQQAIEQAPAGFLIDWDGLDQKAAYLIDLMQLSQRPRTRHVPVLFMSLNGGVHRRLQSVRAGGDAFFVKPFELSRLIDRLDALIGAHEHDPYRILIVEDSTEEAHRLARILAQDNVLTRPLSDPLELLTLLNDFHPDLILLETRMAACSGEELATVIRQQESSDSVPIVFLSEDAGREETAIRQMGDGVLSKALSATAMQTAVQIAAERSRTLRALMQRDSLTGLLNHTATKRRLDAEIQRARRYGHTLSLAMIDIDHFKKVNDTYGHAAGDTVLKSLARLLQQRLRAADVVGRYGGEEFAVIMPETDGPAAVRILDRIRVSFSQLNHQAAEQEFHVQFSAGVAEYPLCETATELYLSADTCLYDAKRNGRNQVVLFN